MDGDPLEPKPPVGTTRGLSRQHDGTHVGSNWLNQTTDYEFETRRLRQRHISPPPQGAVWVVIRSRDKEISRLRTPVAEPMGDTPYLPPAMTDG